MIKRLFMLVVAILLLRIVEVVSQSSTPLLYGSVVRQAEGRGEVPIPGLKVVLEQPNRPAIIVYTGPHGKFAVYSLPNGFGSYTLKVLWGENLMQTQSIDIPKQMTRVKVQVQ